MISDALATAILRREFTDSAVWLALHASDPRDGAEELTVRQLSVWAEPIGRECSLAERPVWDPMPSAKVTHWSAWDAAVGGTVKWTGRFGTAITVAAGDGFRIPAGELTVYFE